LPDPALFASALSRSLGLREAEERTPGEALRYHLRDKRLLLVLDNFEHLLGAAVEVAGLLDRCSGLVVLATSRAPLRVRGEQEYPVPPLALPSSTVGPSEGDVIEAPSGRLFLERARAVSPAFTITEENAGDVAAICWRLAGLPLALELAAAKARVLEPAALLARLDRALSTAWARDLPERQRTMRSTLDWSHELLSEPERVIFRRLSVFSGGFTLESAEEACAFGEVGPEEVLEFLARLTEQSLVTVSSDAEGTRYGMLEPVRQYALERLEESGEGAAARERHAEHFVALVEKARPVFLGPNTPCGWGGSSKNTTTCARPCVGRGKPAMSVRACGWWGRSAGSGGCAVTSRRDGAGPRGFSRNPSTTIDRGTAGCGPGRCTGPESWPSGMEISRGRPSSSKRPSPSTERSGTTAAQPTYSSSWDRSLGRRETTTGRRR